MDFRNCLLALGLVAFAVAVTACRSKVDTPEQVEMQPMGISMAKSIKVVFFDLGDTLVISNDEQKEWIPGAREVLKRLSADDVRIGVISNTGPYSRKELMKYLPEDFDFGAFDERLIVLSSEVGISKPDLGIFRLALQRAEVSPPESLYVGEKLSETLVAQRSGMKAARVHMFPEDFEDLTRLLNQEVE